MFKRRFKIFVDKLKRIIYVFIIILVKLSKHLESNITDILIGTGLIMVLVGLGMYKIWVGLTVVGLLLIYLAKTY